jgi:hypothetical protein
MFPSGASTPGDCSVLAEGTSLLLRMMLLQSLPLKELVQCRELGTNHGLPTIVGQMAMQLWHFLQQKPPMLSSVCTV